MPLCGFNQEMLEGLRMFHKGLVAHGLLERSKSKNQSISKTLEQELNDMDKFLKEIPRISDPHKRAAIENLTKYAQMFYTLVKQEGIDKADEIIESLNKTYESMDRKFYSELENQPDGMRRLVDYINSQ